MLDTLRHISLPKLIGFTLGKRCLSNCEHPKHTNGRGCLLKTRYSS